MFDWAREQARDLDNEFASTGKLKGALHGVPVSLQLACCLQTTFRSR